MKKLFLLLLPALVSCESVENYSVEFAQDIATAKHGEATHTYPIMPVEVVGENGPRLLLPSCYLEPKHVGVVFVEGYPRSEKVAAAYQKAYGIPKENLVGVTLPIVETLSTEDFALAYEELSAEVPDHIQVLALAWTRPFRVGNCKNPDECMSVTSAFALGYNPERWSKNSTLLQGDLKGGKRVTLKQEATSAYFASNSCRPFDDFSFRPAMLLPGTPEEVDILIQRGKRSILSFPKGSVHLVTTTDPARNVRTHQFDFIEHHWRYNWNLDIENFSNLDGAPGDDEIRDSEDVLFYFTGLPYLFHTSSNKYLPGSVGEHLTSYGGVIRVDDSLKDLARLFRRRAPFHQTTVLAWLNLKSIDSGVTGSFGTVVEPYALPQKFTNTAAFLAEYTSGSQLVVSMWKSVQFPGQGLFVGDPLARPWGSKAKFTEEGDLVLTTTELDAYASHTVQRRLDHKQAWEDVEEIPARRKTKKQSQVRLGEKSAVFEWTLEDADPTMTYRIIPSDTPAAER